MTKIDSVSSGSLRKRFVLLASAIGEIGMNGALVGGLKCGYLVLVLYVNGQGLSSA